MIRQPISNHTRIWIQILSIIIIISLYLGLSVRQHIINPKDKTVPSISQLISVWQENDKENIHIRKWLAEDFYDSGIRFSLGISIGVLSAFVVGILMGVYPKVEAFFQWPIKFLGSIPPTAMLAIYFIVFGIDLQMYVAMIAFGIFPSIALSIYRAAITDVTDHAISKAYTLGADSFEVIIEVICRQIFPRIIEFVRICIGPALIFLIAAEWSNASVGFGYRLKIQSRLANMNVVYTYLILLSLISFCVDYLLLSIRRKFCPWFGDK